MPKKRRQLKPATSKHIWVWMTGKGNLDVTEPKEKKPKKHLLYNKKHGDGYIEFVGKIPMFE